MGRGLDTKSYFDILLPDSVNACRLTPLPGSAYADSPAQRKILLAGNGSFEPTNFCQGVTQPVFTLNTVPYWYWFNPTNLNALYVTRDSNTGFLTGGGVSPATATGGFPCAFDYSPGNTGAISGAFSDCKSTGLTVNGGAEGDMVTCQLGMMPYGSDGDATSMGTPQTPGTASPFMSQGVEYNADGLSSNVLDGVIAWSINLSNGLRPRVTTPLATIPDGTAKIYPSDYYSAPFAFVVTVVQELSGAHPDAESPSAVRTLYFRLNDPGKTHYVLFTLKVLDPLRSVNVNDDLGIITRTYSNISPAVGTASLAISGA